MNNKRFFIPVCMAVLAFAMSKPGAQKAAPPGVLFHHHTFRDFSKGNFSDAGGNLYVSKQGRLQFVNTFDLNFDGYPEIVVNNDHNIFEAPDALVYYNKESRGLRSLTNPTTPEAPAYQNLIYTLESLNSITRLPTEGGGRTVVTDLNLDGYKDLVFVNFIHGSTNGEIPTYIYWGGADGLNAMRRSLLPADRGAALAVDDLNGDGLPDIVVANSGREHMGAEMPNFSHDTLAQIAGDREKTSYVFIQTEAGFTMAARQTVATNYATDVKIADLNNDGKKELIFLELGAPGALRIVEQQNGKWNTSAMIPVIAPKPLTSGRRIYSELLVKDLNGDGYADIFAPSSGKQSEIFWNNKGKFAATNKALLETDNAMSADATDLNKDGFTDLVIANFYSPDKSNKPNFETNSYIWWGASGGFKKESRQALPTLGAVGVRLADVNNTGRTDIIFAQYRDQRTMDVPSYVYFNSANGFFTANRVSLQGFGTVGLGCDDLDGNGKKEVILINSMSGKAYHSGYDDGPGHAAIPADAQPMYIYPGNPFKMYSASNIIRVPQSSAETNIAFADMDDDNKADLIHLRGSGFRLVIRYDVYDYPASKTVTEIPIPFKANSVNVADFNKDGILDVLATPITGPQGMLFFGQGNHQYKTTLFDFPHWAYSCVVGDINNDGWLDAIGASHKEICIFPGSMEGGRFHFKKPAVVITDMLTTRVSLADFNKDGWLDILSENLQNTYTKVYDVQSWVLINNKGTFSLDNKRGFATYGANGGTIAQLSNDGKMDVVISNYHADASRRVGAFVLYEGADGFPSEQNRLRLPAYSSGANIVLDFNGDGYQDIAVFNHTGNEIYNGGLNPSGGTHGIGSFVYWGGQHGYGMQDRTWIPSYGPHSRIMADPGSLGRRNPFEIYTSDIIKNTAATENFTLTISGRFNEKQFVEAAIIGNGVTASQLVSKSPAEISYRVTIPKGQSFKYRLQLNSSHSGSGPVVESVKMVADKN
jgi:hypothetical protein